jgi:hypothetical protein
MSRDNLEQGTTLPHDSIAFLKVQDGVSGTQAAPWPGSWLGFNV